MTLAWHRVVAGLLYLYFASVASTSDSNEDVDPQVALLQNAVQLNRENATQVHQDLTVGNLPTIAAEVLVRVFDPVPDPLFYLHLPKTGGGFANTIAHAVCAQELPEHYYMIGPKSLAKSNYSCRHRFARFDEGHQPLSGWDFEKLPEPAAAHVVTLFREPQQRLLSGFYHHRHDCPSIRLSRFCFAEDSDSAECLALSSAAATSEELEPYGRCVGSCQARLVAGYRCAGDVPMPEDLAKALDRIDRFAFVGLTEEFSRSVCLFHLRFGGRCLDVEFVNSRQGGHSSNVSTGYSTTAVSDYVNITLAADVSVYNRAKARFWREVLEYGATDEACSRVCPAFGKQIDLSQFATEHSSGLRSHPCSWSQLLLVGLVLTALFRLLP
mmetsp:Transcript_1631/g.4232  ORF Transcript_1631/g.4232 Transcript_1631/m.4232 type:complete len:383 (+) Transcript_1631:85-1233(+)